IMHLVHRGQLPDALAIVDECHTRLHRRRREVSETLEALRLIAAGPGAQGASGSGVGTARHAPSTVRRGREAPLLRIGDAARRVGVRVSALRFWEEQGLLRPQRDKSSGYRLYDDRELLRLQVVTILRKAGYDFPAIRAVLDELAEGRPSTALSAIERRREELTVASERCSRATAAFWSYVAEVFGKPEALSGSLPRPSSPA
ncbi:MAG TPA: MerR family transcriptional regulator, partial [Chloroflexota bacterium]|nr:MerR family transcriptional regulator [Chloroflexota bacterium]